MTRHLSLAAAAIAVSAFALDAGAAASQAGRTHLSPEGRPCIRLQGITYDRPSDWNYANFTNDCDFSITLDYTRYDPSDRTTKGSNLTVGARRNGIAGTARAILFQSDGVSWTERFDGSAAAAQPPSAPPPSARPAGAVAKNAYGSDCVDDFGVRDGASPGEAVVTLMSSCNQAFTIEWFIGDVQMGTDRIEPIGTKEITFRRADQARFGWRFY